MVMIPEHAKKIDVAPVVKKLTILEDVQCLAVVSVIVLVTMQELAGKNDGCEILG